MADRNITKSALQEMIAGLAPTLKELAQNVRELHESQIRVAMEVDAMRKELSGVHEQLARMNGTVRAHSEDIARHDTWIKAVATVGGLGTLIGAAIGAMLLIAR